jgi:ABC-type multidrug transport system ATPase subunit
MSRLEILERFRKFQSEGMTLVVSSHNMEDIAALAQQTLVLVEGRQHALGSTAEVFEDAASLQEAGMEPPVVVQVVSAMRCKGWPLPSGILTLEELAGMMQSIRESTS